MTLSQAELEAVWAKLAVFRGNVPHGLQNIFNAGVTLTPREQQWFMEWDALRIQHIALVTEKQRLEAEIRFGSRGR
jgi:hypothetical protein